MTDATSGDPTEVLSDATKVLSDPAGVLFGLEGEFHVLFVQRIGPTAVKMIIEQIAREGPCPVCGVLSSVVKDRPLMQLKDLPACGQAVELWWRKRRLLCGERLCPRPAAVRPRGRVTERLRDKIATAIARSNRSVADIAAEYGVSWPTAHKAQAGAVGAYSLDHPQGVQVTTGAASDPVDGAPESCTTCWELSLIEDLATRTGQDGQGVIAGVGINAGDERVGVRDHRHG
jgi:hypothetical protein